MCYVPAALEDEDGSHRDAPPFTCRQSLIARSSNWSFRVRGVVMVAVAFSSALSATVASRRASRASSRGKAAAGCRLPVMAAAQQQITGVVFEPFTAVQHELAVVDKTEAIESFARVDFHPECEAAINEQINIEYNVSYVYHALWAYFDRDNVGLPGLAAWFKKESEEERHHAELLMAYQNLRGGKVKLQSIMMPEMEFDHKEKGDALYAMELVLSLEKLNFQKLRHLHEVAEKHGDSQMCDFVEGQLLADQVESVKQVAEYVSQLRRVGKGLGVYQFDKSLQA